MPVNSSNKWLTRITAIAIAGLVGCSSTESPPSTMIDGAVIAAVTTPPSPGPRVQDDAPELLARARQAMREGRMASPAGDNATDYYLALRGHLPDDPDVASALIELQPYVLLAAEQAIAGSDIEDATRLLAAMAGIDSGAPSLPRLRTSLAAAEQRIAQALADEQASPGAQAIAAAAARGTAPPAPPPTLRPAASPQPGLEAQLPAMVETAGTQGPEPVPTRPVAVATPAEAPATRVPSQPRLLRDVAPRYPIHALRRGLSGWVRVSFIVRPDGSVDNPRLIASQPEGVFDQAALAVARQWRFEESPQATTIVRDVQFEAPKS